MLWPIKRRWTLFCTKYYIPLLTYHMFSLVVSLQLCKSEDMKNDCNKHGLCENDMCTCYSGFTGEFCTDCAEGF